MCVQTKQKLFKIWFLPCKIKHTKIILIHIFMIWVLVIKLIKRSSIFVASFLVCIIWYFVLRYTMNDNPRSMQYNKKIDSACHNICDKY